MGSRHANLSIPGKLKPYGWITLSRLWPPAQAQLLGPFWPLLLLNLLYVARAHARGQLVCPPDPTPERRLGFCRGLRCDAVLSDDPGATRRALRQPGSFP